MSAKLLAAALLFFSLVAAGPTPLTGQGPRPAPVRVWEDSLMIPTYALGAPSPDPVFYTGEQYQGAQRHVYPYALQDALTDRRAPRRYLALHLENAYLRITVLPELGGRIFAALDKTNGYDFFYRQHVIKPALIGMLGAWVSGGVEWDVFHHHRATSFMPVDYALAANADGSKTIWVGELEHRERMRWLVGLTLRPGRSYLETTVRLINRTPLPQTMLYWANAAVHADSQYQFIFPPNVRVVTFHAKNSFSRWPIGSGIYAGVDYTGVDLSWWKNSRSPTSFFAWNLRDDFSGGYDHGREAGVVHVGDHGVTAGAKVWEWGPADAGRLWDTRILTDSDGPYAELMVGAYSDNQPDYSWFQPYDTRGFTDYWYPVRGIGGFKQATRDAAVSLAIANGVATLGFHTTAAHRGARAVLRVAGRAVLDAAIAIDPGHPFVRRVPLPPGTVPADVTAELLTARARLVSYRPAPETEPPGLPEPVRPPPSPGDAGTADELLAIGERAEQINSPTVDPEAYFAEALRRDSGDARANLRLGERLIRRWRYADAERYLRRALLRLGPGYTNPGNTEVFYQLGLALRGQGQLVQAREAFERTAWDQGHRAAALHQLAELSLTERDYARALSELEDALAVDAASERARAFQATALRHLGRTAEAQQAAATASAGDPFAFLAWNEKVLALRARGRQAAADAQLAGLTARMRGDVESYLELAADYEDVTLWDEAVDVLQRAADLPGPSGQPYPMVSYHLAYAFEQQGHGAEAARRATRAALLPPDYCFPFRFESVAVLRAALRRDPRDARAWYYLGNLLYERQPDAAIEAWERSRGLDPQSALVHRNLGWAYRWTEHDLPKAIASYEQAHDLDPRDGRIAVELDESDQFVDAPLEARLASLRRSQAGLLSDGLAREALILTSLGRYDQALDLLEHTRFHVEELAGALHDAFVDAHLLRGLQRLGAKDATGALADFTAAGTYPENLEVGRPLEDARAPQIAYYAAVAQAAAGDSAAAHRLLEQAAFQPHTEAWPEARLYQALALERLGRKPDADTICAAVVRAGEQAVARATEAGSAAQPRAAAREAAARRLLGLGLLGRGDLAGARRELGRAVELNPSDPWARYHLAALEAAR
jgi:tetratricopeptide (TPR) repeat protein